ncbi:hypothetical protein ABPG77_008721 [Micractinium sp. CCAP 211/92]
MRAPLQLRQQAHNSNDRLAHAFSAPLGLAIHVMAAMRLPRLRDGWPVFSLVSGVLLLVSLLFQGMQTPLLVSILLLVFISVASTLAWLWLTAKRDVMRFVQIRRRMQIWRFRLTTLRRRPVTLHEFHSATTAAYAARRFRRPLHPAELQQLACHAGFPLAAAVSLAACLEAAERCSQGAAELQQSLKRISLVGIPPWRFYFYLWWFTSHLNTLELVRREWEHQEPQLIGGFDLSRSTAVAMLFRRPKGTCMLRLGMEAGGLIVSVRPDNARLQEEPRTLESYIGSVSVASLAGGAYQLAAEANLPPEQRRREGQVMHIYLPDGSLAQHDGLLGCLTHMRHTRHLLCPASGEVVPTVQALRPPPASSTTLLTEQREELLQQALQELVQPAEVAGDEETQRVMQHMVERLQQQLAQRRAQQAERAEQARQRSLSRPRRSRRPAPAPAAPAPHDSALDVEWRALLRGGD